MGDEGAVGLVGELIIDELLQLHSIPTPQRKLNIACDLHDNNLLLLIQSLPLNQFQYFYEATLLLHDLPDKLQIQTQAEQNCNAH